MHNKSEIMNAAWANYRRIYPARSYRFCRVRFSGYLRNAWADAKRNARLNALPSADLQNRIATLKEQIATAEYLPSRMSLSDYTRPLKAELASLEKLAA